MKRINLLSEETSNKIAAGEVVERPSSVVKELVENSIDAGSKNIIIEIEDGGSTLIRISDDGEGIYPEDVEKAFMPHGTSKIKNIEDIYNINSFGFRGEALASIASVSKVRMKSRIDSIDFGKEIYIEGGNIKHITEVGFNRGTEIEIRDLFYNVPARQKFLKSTQREKAIINDLVLKLAMGNYDVSFKLYNDGKEIYKTFGGENLRDTLRVLYGKEVYENILPIENHNDIVSVYGFIGKESISRGSRNRQTIFVNKRIIKNSLITTAVENAFRSFATVNKFPFFTVFLEIFPEYIDPNVHPTKSEVKFLEERTLFKTVFDGVHNALKESYRSSFAIDEEKEEKEKKIDYGELIQVEFPMELKGNNFLGNNHGGYISNSDIILEEKVKEAEEISVKEYIKEKEGVTDEVNYTDYGIKEQRKTPKFPSLKIIGQFYSSYILGESGDQLYIIDQHAAHEKINFEKYIKEIKNSQVVSQILLEPMMIELNFEDYEIYKENAEVFEKTGFLIEEFGDNAIIIRETPLILGKPNIKELFYDILENIKRLGNGSTVEVKYNKIASISCKASVKANNKLSNIEMDYLIEELRYIEEPFTCPHGRPTIVKYSIKDIEKVFRRII